MSDPRELAFRESFYLCCGSNLAKIRMLSRQHVGFLSVQWNGEPLAYSSDNPESQRLYLKVLEGLRPELTDDNASWWRVK